MQVLVTLTHVNFGGNPLYQATKHLNGEKRNVELHLSASAVAFVHRLEESSLKLFKCTFFPALDAKTMLNKKQGNA